MRRVLPGLCLAVATLATSGPGSAHVTAEPPFVASGEHQTLAIEAPNEREAAPMSGLSVTVPPELSIVEALPAREGWDAVVESREASWSGGVLPTGATARFPLVVVASGEPGEVTLAARQLYPDGEQVEWAVPLTILPGEESGSRAPVLLVAGIATVVVAGVLVLVLLRRRGSPPER